MFNADSTLILVNCTLANNQAIEGAGVKNYAGTVTVTNCTFFKNSTGGGGGAGIWSGGWSRARTVVSNSLFADGGAGDELHQEDVLEVTGDYNVSRDGSAPGPHSRSADNAVLGDLGRYGGPTETVPLLTDSPALDAGDNERVPAGVRTDQRGLPRVRNGKVDVGAFEAQ